MQTYHLETGGRRIGFGYRVQCDQARLDPARPWAFRAARATAREIVEALDVLLATVFLQIERPEEREALLEQAALSLAIDGREAVLPLSRLRFDDPRRQALRAQAARIGTGLATMVKAVSDAGASRRRHGRDALAGLQVRSRCDGHVWSEAAAAALTGPDGSAEAMQLFNEWLHQLVLLRDCLLPFSNWEEARLAIDDAPGALRCHEAARRSFLAALFTGQVAHEALVHYAAQVGCRQAPASIPEHVYGFENESGAVLPADFDGLTEAATGSLLRWHPARLRSSDSAHCWFVYEFGEYYAAPRSLPPLRASSCNTAAAWRALQDAGIACIDAGQDRARLDFVIHVNGTAFRVDLGQALRGIRFAYRASGASERHATPAPAAPVIVADPQALLLLPGLVDADEGVYLIEDAGNPLVTLSLLGKIYPQNVILGAASDLQRALAAGKQFGARFVLAPLAPSSGA